MELEKTDLQTEDLIVRKPSGWGTRHTLALLGFWSFAINYAMRFNLSLAIVAMVNRTGISVADTKTTDACPHLKINVNDTLVDGAAFPIHDSMSSQGEFNWNPAEQGLILGSFFWGYFVMQLPGGILAKRFGGKWTLGIGILITGIFAILTPLAARTSKYFLILVRVIQGLGEGVSFPAMHTLLASWAPPSERSQLASIIYAGAQFGTAITMVMGGYLIDGEVFGGWPSVFYVTGIISLVWFLCWSLMVHDSPAEHPNISVSELTYIESTLGTGPKKTKVPTPWKSILTSKPVYSLIVISFGHAWGLYTMLILTPTYLKTVLHFEIKNNSWISAMPHLIMWVVSIALSQIADLIIERKLLPVLTVRKMFTALGHLGSAAALIGASFSGCDATTTVTLLTIALAIEGATYAGFYTNHIEIAPNHAGIVWGIATTFSNCSGFLAPYIAGVLIKQDPSLQNWQYVFLIAAGIYVAGVIFYTIFAEAAVQPWSEGKNTTTHHVDDVDQN